MLADTVNKTSNADVVNCEHCGNPIDTCMCECPYSAKLMHVSVVCLMRQQADR